MKVSDLFVKALENEGVKQIFTVPGEENLDLLESIRTSSIKLIVLRHEQVAGFMAATYGRMTGKPGVCLTTLGAGATNLVTAVAHAQLGGMPMVVISGQKPITRHRQGRFQVVDVVTMMRPLTKHTETIVDGSHVPAMVRQAFHIAAEETPGVVHLELPEDIAQEKTKTTQLFTPAPIYPLAASQTALDKGLKMIQAAKHPLLMIGAGANRFHIRKALEAFVSKIAIPFFTTQMGKGILDEHSHLCLGTSALSQGDFIHCAIRHADLIINVGHDTVEKPPFLMSKKGPKVIHINTYAAQVDETYFPQLQLVGDPALTIKHIGEKLSLPDHCDLSYYHKIRKNIEEHIQKSARKERMPISAPHLVKEVQKAMPKDGILSFDNGMYKIWFARNYKASLPNTFLLDNALATMGAGVAVGMAAKMIYPERKVVCICGDGGFLMNANALASAVDLKLDLVIMVLQDDGYGMIKWQQAARGLPDFGLSFGNPDFVKFAKSHNVSGVRITHAKEVGSVLARCLKKGGVHLVEVPIDYAKDYEVLGKELDAYTCKL